MNASHQINRKLNRYNRLVTKLKGAPTDDKKKQRKQELAYELNQAGIKV